MTDVNDDEVQIPFKERIPLADCEKVTIVHEVNDVKKKTEMPLANSSDTELILRVIEEFNDVAKSTRLNLSMGPLKFEKFRECLAGSPRDDWDTAREGQPETNAGFQAAITAFIATFLDEDSLEEQKLYMNTIVKPHRMSCNDAYVRLKRICALMHHLARRSASH